MSRARTVTVLLATLLAVSTLAGAGASAAAVPTGSPTAADPGVAAGSPDAVGSAGPPGSTVAGTGATMVDGTETTTAVGTGVTTADAEPTNVTYGEPDRDETARSALRTDDGGYVLTGTVPGSDGETATFVTRLDDRGSVAWTETLEFTVGGLFGFDGLERAHDDGYLVGGVEYVAVTANGTTAYGVPRARLVALGADGDVRWDRRYANGTAIYDVVRLEEGGYLLAGYRQTAPGSESTENVGWIARTEGDGDLRWERTFPADGADRERGPFFFSAAPETGDAAPSASGYVAVGVTGNLFGRTDLHAVRVDPDGDVRWERSYDVVDQLLATDVVATGSGYAVTGGSGGFASGTADGFVASIAPDGDLEWSRTYPDRLRGAVDGAATDGWIAVAGPGARSGDADGGAVVLELDDEGDVDRSRRVADGIGTDLLWRGEDDYAVVSRVNESGAAAEDPSRDVLVATVGGHNGSTPPDDGRDLPTLPGADGPPTDVDGDGAVEDVDGDGTFDVFDVQTFLETFDGDAVRNNAAAFDFDDRDGVTIFDVQALLEEL